MFWSVIVCVTETGTASRSVAPKSITIELGVSASVAPVDVHLIGTSRLGVAVLRSLVTVSVPSIKPRRMFGLHLTLRTSVSFMPDDGNGAAIVGQATTTLL